jgi:hypothetical protein
MNSPFSALQALSTATVIDHRSTGHLGHPERERERCGNHAGRRRRAHQLLELLLRRHRG